ARASKATSVIVMTSPSVSRRRAGAQTLSRSGTVSTARASTEGSSTVTGCMLPPCRSSAPGTSGGGSDVLGPPTYDPWHAVRPMASRHQADPEHLWHYGEDPAIERFLPHVPATNPD